MKINRAEGIFSIIMLAVSAISAMIIFKMISSLKNLINKILILIIFNLTFINVLTLSSPIKVIEKDIFTSNFTKEVSTKKDLPIPERSNDEELAKKVELIEKKDMEITLLNIDKNKKRLSEYVSKKNIYKSKNNIFIKGTKLYGLQNQYILPIKLIKFTTVSDIKCFSVKNVSDNYECLLNGQKHENRESNIVLPLNISEFQGGIY